MLVDDGGGMERAPLIVELIGPAGAGKSTLARALSRRSDKILIGVPPLVRRVGNIPFFVKNALLLVPTLLRLAQDGMTLTGSELAEMMRLKGWHQSLRRQASDKNAIILLDHGPIFMLAQLCGFGPEGLRSQKARGWWDRMFKQWAAAIDMVIWLDAPDAILMERINSRNQTHMVKGKPEQDTYMFLTDWRTLYQETMTRLLANGDMTLLCYCTGQESPDRIADQILAKFELELGEE